jgi:very-short-patch-repair endonuclease
MHRYDLPPPEPQVTIHDRNGRFVAKVDFAWLRRGVVGEADGRAKYADGDDPIVVFDAEKDRHARLEAIGLAVVRWNARHLFGDPPVLIERLRAALEAGDGRRFKGRAA